MMVHLMAFWARIDKKANENFTFSLMVHILMIAVGITTIAIFISVVTIYPVLLLAFPLVVIGWILKVGVGK